MQRGVELVQSLGVVDRGSALELYAGAAPTIKQLLGLELCLISEDSLSVLLHTSMLLPSFIGGVHIRL